MILYKYRHCSAKTREILKSQKVWLAKSNTLNDPCECSMHDLSPEWVNKTVKEMKRGQMGGVFFSPQLFPKAFLKEIEATLEPLESFDDKYLAFRNIYEKHHHSKLSNPDLIFSKLDAQLNSIGIFSLASISENPLMWSHYGDEHKGICLGFEVRDLTPSADANRFLKVRYSDDIPKLGDGGFTHQIAVSVGGDGKMISEGRIALTDATVRAAISTKAMCWSYEKEWRYIESNGGNLYPFPGPLVEIVFGFRCSPENRAYYTKLAKTHLINDVRLYEIRRAKNSFMFERVFLGVCSSDRDIAGANIPEPLVLDETSIADTYPLIQKMFENGQHARVLPALEEALEKDPQSARLWRTKGVAFGSMQRDEEALYCFDRAIELYPEFFSAWYHRGVALSLLGRIDDTILAYEKARALNPNDGSTLFNLAYMYGAIQNTEKAKDLLLAAEKAGHPRAHEALRDIELAKQTGLPENKSSISNKEPREKEA